MVFEKVQGMFVKGFALLTILFACGITVERVEECDSVNGAGGDIDPPIVDDRAENEDRFCTPDVCPGPHCQCFRGEDGVWWIDYTVFGTDDDPNNPLEPVGDSEGDAVEQDVLPEKTGR
jgi:hypothetical protein